MTCENPEHHNMDEKVNYFESRTRPGNYENIYPSYSLDNDSSENSRRHTISNINTNINHNRQYPYNPSAPPLLSSSAPTSSPLSSQLNPPENPPPYNGGVKL